MFVDADFASMRHKECTHLLENVLELTLQHIVSSPYLNLMLYTLTV
jgi:hypothetical protein